MQSLVYIVRSISRTICSLRRFAGIATEGGERKEWFWRATLSRARADHRAENPRAKEPVWCHRATPESPQPDRAKRRACLPTSPLPTLHGGKSFQLVFLFFSSDMTSVSVASTLTAIATRRHAPPFFFFPPSPGPDGPWIALRALESGWSDSRATRVRVRLHTAAGRKWTQQPHSPLRGLQLEIHCTQWIPP